MNVLDRQWLRRRHLQGFTLVEATISVLLMGTVFVAMLHTVGASKTTQFKNAQRRQCLHLADDLMSEILGMEYEEPDDAVTFGRELGEASGIRQNWDDVDDYNGWSSTPERADNTPITWATNYMRAVTVERIDPADLTQTSGTETGIKRITVTVKQNGRVIGNVWAFRTSASDLTFSSQEPGN